MATQSDKIAKAVLDFSTVADRFRVDEVEELLKDEYGDDAPSRKTIRNRLNGLAEVGLLSSWGGRGRTWQMYSLKSEYRDGLATPPHANRSE